jgi:hypothetical protein
MTIDELAAEIRADLLSEEDEARSQRLAGEYARLTADERARLDSLLRTAPAPPPSASRETQELMAELKRTQGLLAELKRRPAAPAPRRALPAPRPAVRRVPVNQRPWSVRWDERYGLVARDDRKRASMTEQEYWREVSAYYHEALYRAAQDLR